MNPNSKRRVLLAWALGCALAGPAHAGQVYDCPQRVRLTSIAVAGDELPAGMRAVAAMPQLPFTSARLFDGAPERGGVVLAPASVQRGGGTVRWNTARLGADRVWLSCEYAGGVVRVVARLQASTYCIASTAGPEAPGRVAGTQLVCQ